MNTIVVRARAYANPFEPVDLLQMAFGCEVLSAQAESLICQRAVAFGCLAKGPASLTLCKAAN